MIHTLSKSHLLPISTSATGLRGVSRIDCDEPPASFYRFARQLPKERRPCCIRDTLRQAVIVLHSVDVQIFDTNDPEGIHNATTVLVSEVFAFPSHPLMNPSDDFAFVVSLTGAFLHVGKLPLRFGKGLFLR